MKNCLKWIILFCCALLLCSCGTSSLDTDTQQKIQQDYALLKTSENDTITADDVTIERYLGTYQDGAIALFITAKNEGYLQAVVEEEIAGIHFTFPDYQPLYIYSDSQFTPLKKAYESNIITKSDVEKIYDLMAP